MERIGIYGGSFNPVHLGHIRGAEAAAKELNLDRVIFLPAKSVHSGAVPKELEAGTHRLRMLQIAAEGSAFLEVSDLELSGKTKYTWESLERFREVYPSATLYLILGSDLLGNLDSWVSIGQILELADIAVLRRGEKGEQMLLDRQLPVLEAMGARIHLLSNETLTISSTQLRRLLAFGCGASFLPQAVGAYIREQGLYHVNANWKNLPMEELEQVVISLLNPNRVAHVLGCRDTAVELARRWGADETDAARAGILHDVTKALDGPLQLTVCAEYGRILSDFSRKYAKTLHALTGSLVAERIFGENEAVVSAIRHHTTGKPDMSLLEKIIYVADYMEPNRDIPGVEELRRLAFTDIPAALKLGLEMTLEHLNRQGSEVARESREALAWLNR